MQPHELAATASGREFAALVHEAQAAQAAGFDLDIDTEARQRLDQRASYHAEQASRLRSEARRIGRWRRRLRDRSAQLAPRTVPRPRGAGRPRARTSRRAGPRSDDGPSSSEGDGEPPPSPASPPLALAEGRGSSSARSHHRRHLTTAQRAELARVYLLPKAKEQAEQRRLEGNAIGGRGGKSPEETPETSDTTEREAHYQAGAQVGSR